MSRYTLDALLSSFIPLVYLYRVFVVPVIMDAVSTSIGFVASAIKAIQFVRKTLKDLKDAPMQLQTLSDRVADIEFSLTELQRNSFEGLFGPSAELEPLERWCRNADACVQSIEAFTAKVNKVRNDGELVVDRWQWLRKGDTLDDFGKNLDRLQSTLGLIINFISL